MAIAVRAQLSQFALDVAEGLSHPLQKRIPSRYFYDALGSHLFEAITLLPEYGLTRADERLLRKYAREMVRLADFPKVIAELGSGTGSKARFILKAAAQKHTQIRYFPIDVCSSALSACHRRYSPIADVTPICAEWNDALKQIAKDRTSDEPLLLLFLGSSIGNLDRSEMPAFLRTVRSSLRCGDTFLLGADLIKDTEVMLAAYDDPTGVTAAFNLNVLGRINRELEGEFDLRSFSHEVRWNAEQQRIEMHLLSCCDQTAYIGALNRVFCFCAGETIWTESSHKFTPADLDCLARDSGFVPQVTWLDQFWPFAEALWKPA
jgi:L-histidine N-alpha-methyltransferase